MSSLTLVDVMALSQQYPNLSLDTVQRFILLVSRLKNDILLAQPSSVDESDPPDVLPPTIMTFLQNSCSISEECVNSCWQMLKSTVWLRMKGEEPEDGHGVLEDFAKHGHSRGLCTSLLYIIGVTLTYYPLNLVFRTLYPPQQRCVNPSCSHSRNGKLLKKEEQRQGVLYTLDKGAAPVRSVHLYCRGACRFIENWVDINFFHQTECNTNFHHNFHVKDGARKYYNAVPDVIQIGEHQFAEKRLIQLWITLMLVSW